MRKKTLNVILVLAALVSMTVNLPFGEGSNVLASNHNGLPTTELTVSKYDAHNHVLSTVTHDYTWLENNLPVFGDGVTDYWMGKNFGDEADPWDMQLDSDNELDMGIPKGTDLTAICGLVGGMNPGDTLKIAANDFSKVFDYETIYHPVAPMTNMILSWYNAAYGSADNGTDGYVPNYSVGMRNLFIVNPNHVNDKGYPVFSNWDMHQTLPKSRWAYSGLPSAAQNSVKWIYSIEIHAPNLISCDFSGNTKNNFAAGDTVYVKGQGLAAGSYTIWIQTEPVVSDDALNTLNDPSGFQETITPDANGDFGPLGIWTIPSTATIGNKYDIIADSQTSGTIGTVDYQDYIDNPGYEGFAITMPAATLVPVITSFSPTSAGTGDSVLIHGANLDSVTAVKFGGTSASTFQINSSTLITAIIGSGASGSVEITAPGGTANKSGFTYNKANVSATAMTLSDGVSNTEYYVTLQATGGGGTYTWTLFSRSLPAGLTLNSSTGVISGTATTAGSYSFVIKVADAGDPTNYTTKSYTIVIDSATTATPTPTPTPTPTATPTATSAPAVIRVTLSPASSTIEPGASFSLNLMINTDTAIGGWQSNMTFDANRLTLNSISEGAFLNDYGTAHSGGTIAGGAVSINNTTGNAIIPGWALTGGGGGGPTGSGTLAVLHFTAKTGINGDAPVALSNVMVFSTSAKEITGVATANGLVTINSTSDSDTEPTTEPPVNPETSNIPPNTSVPAVDNIHNTAQNPVVTTSLPGNNAPSTQTPSVAPFHTDTITVTPGTSDNKPTFTKIDFQVEKDITDNESLNVKLSIANDTEALTSSGTPLNAIKIVVNDPMTDSGDGKLLIYTLQCGPDGTTFSNPVSLSVRYDPSLLPEGVNEKDLVMSRYDAKNQKWVIIDSQLDTVNHIITAQIGHFSYYAVAVRESHVTALQIIVVIASGLLVVGFLAAFYIVRRKRALALLFETEEDAPPPYYQERDIPAGYAARSAAAVQERPSAAALDRFIRTARDEAAALAEDKKPPARFSLEDGKITHIVEVDTNNKNFDSIEVALKEDTSGTSGSFNVKIVLKQDTGPENDRTIQIKITKETPKKELL